MTAMNNNGQRKQFGPYSLHRIVLCSADAGPDSQRKEEDRADNFYPGGKWVGTFRNISKTDGYQFVILTTGHGMVNPDKIISPYDAHIDAYKDQIDARWRVTIPQCLRNSQYDIMVFYAGACPRNSYVSLLWPIINDLGISLLTFGKPAMQDIGSTKTILQLLKKGTTQEEIRATLKLPERFEFHPSKREKGMPDKSEEVSQLTQSRSETGKPVIDTMPYTIGEHRHRFAAWAAGRAANVNGCRFSVEQGKEILEKAGMRELISDPNNLPAPQNMDVSHKKWRQKVIDAAKENGLNFSHGVAAKLINIYLKAAFVCGGHHNHESVRAIHPPIDSLLLNELYSKNIGNKRDIWNKARQVRWSKFNSEQYEEIIRNIREVMRDKAFWEVEQYWRGYQ